jgi:hypothetical protein
MVKGVATPNRLEKQDGRCADEVGRLIRAGGEKGPDAHVSV